MCRVSNACQPFCVLGFASAEVMSTELMACPSSGMTVGRLYFSSQLLHGSCLHVPDVAVQDQLLQAATTIKVVAAMGAVAMLLVDQALGPAAVLGPMATLATLPLVVLGVVVAATMATLRLQEQGTQE